MRKIKTSLAAIAFFLSALVLFAQTPTYQLSQPSRQVITCSGTANNCVYPWVINGNTGIIVATGAGSATLVDSLGDVWTRDQCGISDNGNCVFSTHFTVPYPIANVKITFPPNSGWEVYLLSYNGNWTFDQGNYGTYATNNSVFSDCTNGNDCPYSWTLPVEVDAGELLISFADSNANGLMLAQPGFGFNIEASDGHTAVEDMLAPTAGVYIGSLEWRFTDGSPSGGSHWLMTTAAYQKQ
jgi:hypothetical protein